MKKELLFFTLLVILLIFSASLTIAQIPFKSGGTDVCVTPNDTFSTVKTEISVAKNGWIYVLAEGTKYSGQQEWRVYRSVDGGTTFASVCSWGYNVSDYQLKDADLEVTGDNASNINIWVAELSNVGTISPHESYCRLTRWDANGNMLGTPYYQAWGVSPLYFVAINSNYKNGSDGNPLRISIVWTGADPAGGGVSDLLYWAYSNDGGATFATVPDLYVGNVASGDALGRVSVSIGETGYFNARVAIAFERNFAMGTGNIGVICKYNDNTGTWTTPVTVNLADASTNGICAYPTICCMNNYSGYPAASSSFPLIVAYESYSTPPVIKYNILNNTFDMTGTPQASLSDFTDRTGGTNTEEPNMTFDVSHNNFILTYRETSANNLGYVTRNIDDAATADFTYIGTYRDLTSALSWPLPKVDVDLSVNKACFSWIETSSGRADVYFDAGESSTGIIQLSGEKDAVNLFPSPAKEYVNVRVSTNGDHHINFYNAMGQEVLHRSFSGTETQISLNGISPGLYIVKVISGKNIYKGKIEIR